MGIAGKEFRIVWKKLMGKILSEKPSARCPFNCIIMEKGGYWVGVLYFGLWNQFSLPLSVSVSNKYLSK